MACSDLILATVDLATFSFEIRRAVWGLVLDLAAAHDVDGFTLDAQTTEQRVPESVRGKVESLLDVSRSPQYLRHLGGYERSLLEIGPYIQALNLYAGREWIGGISDWGSDISVLFERTSWAEMRRWLTELMPTPRFDEASALSRPILE